MGLCPAEVRALEMWEWVALTAGWRKAHGGGKPAPGLTPEDVRELRASMAEAENG